MAKSYSQENINQEFRRITDIYIDYKELQKSYFYVKNSRRAIYITEEGRNPTFVPIMYDFFTLVKDFCERSPSKQDHTVIFHDHYFRCHIMRSISGIIIACRHMPYDFMELKDLGIPKTLIHELMHDRLNKGGLIFICGAPGNGKTTTCAAVTKERLIAQAGLCIAIEDPPEIPLHGNHGDGKCIQIPVGENETFSDCVRGSMRSYPASQNSIMLLGEIRDADTAVNALKASIDGRLIITTLHSENIISAFERLATLARDGLGGDEAYNLLAQAFRLGIHQTLRDGQLELKFLIDTQAVFSNIRNKRIAFLNTEVEQQENLHKNKKPIQYRNQQGK